MRLTLLVRQTLRGCGSTVLYSSSRTGSGTYQSVCGMPNRRRCSRPNPWSPALYVTAKRWPLSPSLWLSTTGSLGSVGSAACQHVEATLTSWPNGLAFDMTALARIDTTTWKQLLRFSMHYPRPVNRLVIVCVEHEQVACMEERRRFTVARGHG